MDKSSMRNFKDFLSLYNQLSEHCFFKCIEDMSSRVLTTSEAECADRCATKFLKYNNKLMMNFVQRQNDVMARRIKEVEEQQAVQSEEKKDLVAS